MKILCVADHPDPLVYSDNIRKRFYEVDIVISCGDLPFSYYDFIASNLNKPLLFVFGNHHLTMIEHFKKHHTTLQNLDYEEMRDKRPTGAFYIDGKISIQKGIIIGGLGGSMEYNRGPHQYKNYQMLLRIVKMLPRLWWNRIRYGRFIDILVTHAPPAGIHDLPDLCHTGFRPFLWFMRRFKPKYLVHGHIHLYDHNAQRGMEYRDTTVVNAYNHTVIDIVTAGRSHR